MVLYLKKTKKLESVGPGPFKFRSCLGTVASLDVESTVVFHF